MSYAAGTNVGEERSRAEVQWLLEKFGVDQFGYANDRLANAAKIMFRYQGASFVFTLPLADAQDKRVRFTPGGRERVANQISELIAVENRRRWRSLCLTIKAMLVGVEDGILEFGQVFMPYMVWGDGRTTWQALLPTIQDALGSGQALPTLEAAASGRLRLAKD